MAYVASLLQLQWKALDSGSPDDLQRASSTCSRLGDLVPVFTEMAEPERMYAPRTCEDGRLWPGGLRVECCMFTSVCARMGLLRCGLS